MNVSDRLLIDCVNKPGGVVTEYDSIETLMSFINRTGRIKIFRIWARKNGKTICIETDVPYELEHKLREFQTQNP